MYLLPFVFKHENIKVLFLFQCFTKEIKYLIMQLNCLVLQQQQTKNEIKIRLSDKLSKLDPKEQDQKMR